MPPFFIRQMEPLVNNYEPPKPTDASNPSSDSPGISNKANAQLPPGLDTQAILKFCKARNSAFETWFTPKLKVIERYHRIAKNNMVGQQKGSKSVPLPIGFAILEAVNCKLTANLLMRPKFVEVISEVPTSDNSQSETLEDFINQKVKEIFPQVEKGKAAIKSALTDTFVIVRSVWKREPITVTQPIYEPHAVTGETIQTGEQPVTDMKEYWTFEVKNPVNIAWDAHVTTRIQDSSWIRERSKMSYNDLKKWERDGRIWNVDYLKRVVPAGLGGSQREDWTQRLKTADGDTNWGFTYGDEKEYRIDEWFADITYEVEGQTQVIKSHFFICENDYLVFFEENALDPQRHPYISTPCIIDPQSVMGTGLLGPIENLLEQINTYASKQEAMVERFSNPLIFYDESSGLTGRTTFMKLNGLVPVQNANGVKEFVLDANALKVVQQYLEFLVSTAREASGANEQFQGIEGADTATEFQGLQAAAGSRFADMSDTLNQGLFETLSKECWLFYRQFGVDGQMVVHDTAEEGVAIPITKQMLQGQFRFIAVSAATENYKKQQIADDTSFIGEMTQANSMGAFGPGKIYNIPKHIEEISLPLRGAKNSADMFIQLPMPPTMQGPPPGMPGMQGPPGMAGPGGPNPPGMPQQMSIPQKAMAGAH
jgi:hypothetical protein